MHLATLPGEFSQWDTQLDLVINDLTVCKDIKYTAPVC